MSSLGGIKFKMHKMVNYVFYASIFAIGFLIGSGIKLINIFELFKNISNYIFIL